MMPVPIYHGTDDSVLQIAVGHLDWTSLPTGGESTHCVLSGHRGLPSAKLFTNLDQLIEGDTFVIRVLDEVLTYEVDRILIVEPDDVSALQIEPLLVAPAVALPILLILLIVLLASGCKKKPKGGKGNANA